MHAFDVLGDPVRRRILELLGGGERTAGAVTEVVRAEFGITQPAVSQHLKVLRNNGFARVRADGTRRLYSVDAGPLRETDAWLQQFRHFWVPRLDALATEIARGHRERRLRAVGDVVAKGGVVTEGMGTEGMSTEAMSTEGTGDEGMGTEGMGTEGTGDEGTVGPGI